MSSQNCSATKKAKQHSASATLTVCDNVKKALGPQTSRWSEGDWVHYATCFEQRDHSKLAVDAATDGLRHYPNSEPLYNIKGYHEIVQDKHTQAVATLTEGLERVGQPYSGVMENNLAWAALWAPREMNFDQARNLYQRALERESNVCAYLHTGLWVEYAKAKQSSGVERFDAMRRFDQLRNRYNSCLSRIDRGDWKTVVEVAGAGALYEDLQEGSGAEMLRDVARQLKSRHTNKSVDSVCREAMPLETTHHLCVEELNEAMQQVAKAPRRDAKDTASAGSTGGGPCPAMMR